MAHRIEDYFPSSDAPNLRVKNVNVPPASAARPDPEDLDEALQPALDVLRHKRIAALTGAGLSTDSGLPDYRSPGSQERHPMTIQQFMKSAGASTTGRAITLAGMRLARPNRTPATTRSPTWKILAYSQA